MAMMGTSKGSLFQRSYPESERFENLPTATESPEHVFLVRKNQFWHRAGIYRSNGKKWKRLNKAPVTRAELERLEHELNLLKERIEKLES